MVSAAVEENEPVTECPCGAGLAASSVPVIAQMTSVPAPRVPSCLDEGRGRWADLAHSHREQIDGCLLNSPILSSLHRTPQTVPNVNSESESQLSNYESDADQQRKEPELDPLRLIGETERCPTRRNTDGLKN